MPSLHDPEIGTIRKISGYILSIIPSGLMVFSAITKLTRDEFMVNSMEALNLLPSMTLIGVLEVLIVLLYWIPKTMRLGFFLMCSFIGGIMAAELIQAGGQQLPIPGLPMAIFLYVGTFLRKKELSGLNI